MNKEKKILVIDDDKIIRELTKEILKDLGYSVLTAPNGKEGLKLFKKEKPALVISDFMMPGWNGYETAKEIGKISPLTPIIITTGYMNTLEGRPDNVIFIVSKPFTIEGLRAAIEATIGKS